MPKHLKFDVVKLGLACGIITALCVVVTLIGALYGFFPKSADLILDIYSYFGVSVSGIGVILAAIYSFIDAFLLTVIFALIYNKLVS